MTENDFIAGISRRFPKQPPVLVGIGDDGAAVQVTGQRPVIVVTDMLLDGTHFRLSEIDPRLAGRKAMAVNLSDLAAMAARPTAAFVSLAVPVNRSRLPANFLDRLYDGFEELTRQYNFSLAGGDTNSWEGSFAVNVCLLGVPVSDTIPLRSGAQPGDLLYVSGPLGGSLHHQRHLLFSPRFDAAEWLVSHTKLTAMMDISDGLSMDLSRMMLASGTGALLEAAAIPIHEDVPGQLSPEARLTAALGDGEDFELLFTVPEDRATALAEAPLPLRFHCVGRVVEEPGLRIRTLSGDIAAVAASGWQHQV
jgi:thiamine-monophosphate kinase